MYSIISSACAYACKCTQARKCRLIVKNNMFNLSNLTTMAEKKKAEVKDFTQKPVVTEVKSNETFEHELFTIVNHEGEFLVALGNNVVSKLKFTSREEAEHYIDCKPWELILNATAVMWDKLEAIKQQNKQ